MLLQRLEAGDHRLHARARLLVLRQQGRALADQLLLLHAQAAVLFIEAACLRTVGSRNPDPAAAALEEELTALGNYIGIGAMGFAGTSMVVATHVELAYTHTGGMPVGIHQFCLSSRRATARIGPDGRVEFRSDPAWFTDYYRRSGIE